LIPRKSLFEPVGSRKAQLSIDIDKGVVLLREEKPQGLGLLTQGLRRLAQLVGFPLPEEEIQQAETEPVCVQQVDAPRRYRPVDIAELCAATGFTPSEMKRLYRGFKTECPTGVLSEEGFHAIYTGFFPWGEETYHPSTCSYSHYLFSLMDDKGIGAITFGDFVTSLALLIRGTTEDRMLWTFRLYDINGDGVISRDEMEDVALSVYDLMGRGEDNTMEDFIVTEKVNQLFEEMDTDGNGEGDNRWKDDHTFS